MHYKIEIFNKPEIPDGAAENFKKDIADLGIHSARKTEIRFLYFVEGKLSRKQIGLICNKLLADPVTQNYKYSINKSKIKNQKSKIFFIEILYKSGVTDAAGESTKIGIYDLGIKGVQSVRTGMKYNIEGRTKAEAVKISEKLLANKVVHNYSIT